VIGCGMIGRKRGVEICVGRGETKKRGWGGIGDLLG